MQNSTKLILRWIYVLFLLLAFCLRVYQLDFLSIWWDEGHSIQMASAPLKQIATLPGMDVHPPGYFVLLHQWMAVAGRSEFALRYLSLAFSMLTVAVLMRFARQLAVRRGGLAQLFAAGLAGVSPLYVTYAQEVRMYTLVSFLAVTSCYFQWRVISRIRKPAGNLLVDEFWVGYVLAAAASLYSHYFALFLLIFQNLAWLVWVLVGRAGKRRQRLVAWLGGQLAVVILFIPQLALAMRQTTTYANPNLQPPGAIEFVTRTWQTFTLGDSLYGQFGWLTYLVLVVTGVLILFWLWRVLRNGENHRLAVLGYLLAWLLIPLAVYFAVLQSRPSFEPRYMMSVTPALLLLWSVGLACLWSSAPAGTGSRVDSRETQRTPWYRPALGIVTALLLFGALVEGTFCYFTNTAAFKDDSAGVVAWLAEQARPNDMVYVDVPHPFHYYAPRIQAPTRYLFVDVNTAADTLNTEAAGRDHVYWVTWWGSDTDPRGVIAYLLDKAGQRIQDIDFRGYHVTQWQLPPNATFSLPDQLTTTDVTFGDTLRLDGVAYSPTSRPDKPVWATLHFTLLQDTQVDYRASLRLRDADGNMLPPTDKDILNDRHFRTAAWPVEDNRLNQAINVYTLPIPAETTPGSYHLEVVVYDAGTMESLPVNGPTSDGISAWVGSVDLAP